MSRTGKDMDRWLGDGGMPIIAVVGGAFTDYGVDGEDLGGSPGPSRPTRLACNPHGVTQAGVHSLLLDACMNFAINAALPGRARTRGTLEMKTECMRPAMEGERVRAPRPGRADGKTGRLRRSQCAERRRRVGQPGHRDLSLASTGPRPEPRFLHLTSTGSQPAAPGCASSAAVLPCRAGGCASPAAGFASVWTSRWRPCSQRACARCRAPSTRS